MDLKQRDMRRSAVVQRSDAQTSARSERRRMEAIADCSKVDDLGQATMTASNPTATTSKPGRGNKVCPSCSKLVGSKASLCKLCGYKFLTRAQKASSPTGSPEALFRLTQDQRDQVFP
jgi:hypothetical protein